MIGSIHRSASFANTLKYVSRDNRLEPLMDTLAYTKLEGVQYQGMAREMAGTAALSRSKRPCLHVALSPELGDSLSDCDWGKAAHQYVQGMGLSCHQFAVYIHNDATYPDGTERPHAHIVANLVGFDGKQIDLKGNYFRSQRTIREIEQGLGLQHRPSWWEVARDKAIKKEHHEHQRQTTERNRELSTSGEPEQQFLGNRHKRQSTPAISGNLSLEQNRGGQFQQAERLRDGASLDNTGNGADERSIDLGHVGALAGESQAHRQSGDSTQPHREQAGHDAQQRRVEAIAPLLRDMLWRHQHLGKRSGGVTQLTGEHHTLLWQHSEAKLTVFKNGQQTPVLVACRDEHNQWHDLGSSLREEHIKHFTAAAQEMEHYRLQRQRELTTQAKGLER